MAYAPRVYSERFLLIEGADGGTALKTYTVPEGYRAVLTSVLCTNTGGKSQWAWINVHGAYVWAHNFLAADYMRELVCRVPAYERETIRGYCGAQGIHLAASGFLFEDPIGDPISAGVDDDELSEPFPGSVSV